MVGPGICADACASEMHLVFNPVAPYGYLIPNMYLCDVVGPGFVSTSPAFIRSSASHSEGPHGRRQVR